MSFDTDYASLGRFLWDLARPAHDGRDPRADSGSCRASPGDRPGRTARLRVSLTLFAYSRAARRLPGTRDGDAMKLGKPHLHRARWRWSWPASSTTCGSSRVRPTQTAGPERRAPLRREPPASGRSSPVNGRRRASIRRRCAARPTWISSRAPEWPRNPLSSARLPQRPMRPRRRRARAVPSRISSVASILHSADRRLAIVNGRIVRVGDRIGRARSSTSCRGPSSSSRPAAAADRRAARRRTTEDRVK